MASKIMIKYESSDEDSSPRPLDLSSSSKEHCPSSHHPRDTHNSSASALCLSHLWSSETLHAIRPHAFPSDVMTRPLSTEIRNGDPTSVNQEESFSLMLNSDWSFMKGQRIVISDGKSAEERWVGRQGLIKDASPVVVNSAEGPSRREEAVESCVTDAEDDDNERLIRIGTPAASNGGSLSFSQHSGATVRGKEVKQKSHLRKYKYMTTERRKKAYARNLKALLEIRIAFDNLRRVLPSYAHNQELTKLTVLRIACAYINTLSKLAGKDNSASSDSPNFSECVDMVTRSIQTKGKVNCKRDK